MRPNAMHVNPLIWVGSHHPLNDVEQLGTAFQIDLRKILLTKPMPRFTSDRKRVA